MQVDLMDGDPPIDEDALLEVLNSTPVVDGRPTDAWADDRAVAAWARAHGGSGTPGERERLRAVRQDLQAVVSGADPGPLLDRHLDGVTATPRPGQATVWLLHCADPDSRTAALLVLAWADATRRWPDRLRPCANDECRLFLLDRSRPGNARWCSMRSCGNRLKARRHYDRSR